MPPLVTIGMPSHNGERFLEQSLRAILAQELTDFEVIGSDNCSGDRTPEIFEKFARLDRRVRWTRQPAYVSAAHNFQRPLDEARGKYFTWASDHDLWHPKFLMQLVAEMEAHPTIAVCYPKVTVIDLEGREVMTVDQGVDTRGMDARGRILTFVRDVDYCDVMYGLMRTETMRLAGRLGQMFGNDVVFLAKMSQFGEIAWLSEPLFFRRRSRPEDWGPGGLEKASERWLVVLDPSRARRKFSFTFLSLLGSLLCVAWGATGSLLWRLSMVVELAVTFVIKYRSQIGMDFRRASGAWFGPAGRRLIDDLFAAHRALRTVLRRN